MLTINPTKRITAQEALKHPWVCVSIISSWQETRPPLWLKPSDTNERLHCRSFLLLESFSHLNKLGCLFCFYSFSWLCSMPPPEQIKPIKSGFFPETLLHQEPQPRTDSPAAPAHMKLSLAELLLCDVLFSAPLCFLSPRSNAPPWPPWCTDRRRSSAWRSLTPGGNSRCESTKCVRDIF